MRSRSFGLLCILLFVTAMLGLASRAFPNELPRVISTFGGDTLWAATLYWFLALIFRKGTPHSISIFSMFVSFSVELSQLYRAPWVNGLRETQIGGLVLGHGFLWSDLLCYVVGVLMAATVDSVLLYKDPNNGNHVDSS